MNHLKRVLIAVGMALSGHPPHRSVRADFPHTALTSDDDVRNAVRDRDAGSSAPAASRRKVPMLGHGHVDCGVAWCEARVGKGMSSARNSSCRAISESVLRAINWSRGWNNQTIGRGESAEGERNLQEQPGDTHPLNPSAQSPIRESFLHSALLRKFLAPAFLPLLFHLFPGSSPGNTCPRLLPRLGMPRIAAPAGSSWAKFPESGRFGGRNVPPFHEAGASGEAVTREGPWSRVNAR